MTELEKIAYAKSFIDKLANGINPLNDQPIAETDIVNNVRLSRCFFYVSDILRRVIEAGGVTPPKRSGRVPFAITQDQLSKFQFSSSPIPISVFTDRINDLINTTVMKPFCYKQVIDWLIAIGALSEETNSNGKTVKTPTEKGKKLGISVEIRTGLHGDRLVVVYNRDAQQFIIDNIYTIIGSTDNGK